MKEENGRSSFIYSLRQPLSYPDFLDNEIYMSRYRQIMGRQESERTASRFKAGALTKDGYKEITVPVINSRIEKYPEKNENDRKVQPVYSFSSDDASIQFDYEHFLATTSTLVFPAELRTQHRMSLIGRLATVYGLSPDKMRILVSRCVSLEPLEFDENKLRILAERSQPDIKSAADPYLLSPVSFLQSKQNGAQVSRTDKRILEHLSIDMHFSNEVINVMMEYILQVSDNRINEKFVDMVAGEWARNGIKTRQQAVLQVQKDIKPRRKKGYVRVEMPAYMKNEQEKDDEMPSQKQLEELQRRQAEMKE